MRRRRLTGHDAILSECERQGYQASSLCDVGERLQRAIDGAFKLSAPGRQAPRRGPASTWMTDRPDRAAIMAARLFSTPYSARYVRAGQSASRLLDTWRRLKINAYKGL